MMTPTIADNGTSKDELKRQLCRVVARLTTALEAMSEAAPVACDYQPQDESVFAKASAEHRERVDRLVAIRREYLEILEAVDPT